MAFHLETDWTPPHSIPIVLPNPVFKAQPGAEDRAEGPEEEGIVKARLEKP